MVKGVLDNKENLEPQIITPNENQKMCIEAISGPLMVLAGPGTGKTFTVVHRIKNMLENCKILPKNILCLTYSDAAAKEMKSRITKFCGIKGTFVEVNTYHAFCNNVIQRFPFEFELLDDVKLIDDISKVNLAKQAIDEFQPKFLTNRIGGNAYFYINEFLNCVNEIKKSQIDKQVYFRNLERNPNWYRKLEELKLELSNRIADGKLKNITREKNIQTLENKIGKAKEIWQLYEIYQNLMIRNNFIDFEDMINLVVGQLESNEQLLSRVCHYTHFLVDEYQDTNILQNKLIDLLVKGSQFENIFAVGDDDQVIYGFQGAKRDNIENFLKKYPNTNLICLNENNRSSQNILDFSYRLISQDPTRLEYKEEFKHLNIDKRLTAKNKKLNCSLNKKVNLDIFNEIIEEKNAIVEKVERLVNKYKDKLNEIAILTRNNVELQEFAQLFEARNIAYQINQTKSIFEIKSTILTYFYLKILNNHYLSSEKLLSLLNTEPFCIDIEDFKFLLSNKNSKKKNLIEIINSNLDRHNWKDRKKVVDFMETFKELSVLKSHLSLVKLVYFVINKTKILSYFSESKIDTFENILSLNRMLEEAKNFEKTTNGNLTEFLEHLDFAFSENIKIEIEKDNVTKNAVQLITLHGSKGREFEVVFMPNLTSKQWEDKNIRSKVELPIMDLKENIEEEVRDSENLRLLFVGLTRTKHSLNLSFSNFEKSKSRQLTKYLQFAKDESSNLVNIRSHSEFDYKKELIKSLSIKNYDAYRKFENELNLRVKNIVLNPHSLNSYLTCKRMFLYANIYNLKNYDKDMSNIEFGNAIHNTLTFFVQYAKNNGNVVLPTKNQCIEFFNQYLEEHNVSFGSEQVYEQYLSRGHKAIDSYYHHLCDIGIKNVFATELKLEGVVIDEGYKISGRIDRIDSYKKNEYIIIDYKTGLSKPKSQIADGKMWQSYIDQIRMYKIGFESKFKNSRVKKCNLVFPEDQSKVIEFNLDENDDKIIIEKIKNVYTGIKNLEFVGIDPKEYTNETIPCQRCDYKLLCSLNVL